MKKKTSGIVLITTLFTLVFILMVTTTVLVTTKQSMRWAGSYEYQQLALNAAMSGVAYAKMRIQETDKLGQLWQGAQPDGSGGYLTRVINPGINGLKGFSVIEQHVTGGKGIVEGTLQGDGPAAKFFIFFAAPSGTEFIDDLVGTVKPKYLSLNNSNKFTSANSYYIDGTTKYRKVPYCTSLIIVQGQCAGVDKHVEVMMLKYPSAPMDSAGIANGNMAVTLNGGDAQWFVAAELGLPPVIRSNGDLSVESGIAGPSKDFVELNGGRAKIANQVSLNPEYKDPVNLGLIPGQGNQGTIPTMTFTDMQKFLENTQPVNLLAGTYEFSEEEGVLKINYIGEDNIKKVFRDGEVAASTNDPYKVFEFASSYTRAKAGHKVTMKAPLNVVQSGSLNKIILKGAEDSEYELSINMNSTTSNVIYISNPVGDIEVDGELTGKGALYSEGNIAFEGRSALSSDTGTVCLYAKEDITLKGFSKNFEDNPEGNPSSYIAKALDDYLNAKLVVRGTVYKMVDKNDEITKILEQEITYDGNPKNTLSSFLKDKFGYPSADKQKELVDEILRKNNDGVLTSSNSNVNSNDTAQESTSKIYYEFHKDKYHDRLFTIYDTANQDPDILKANAINPNDQILKGVIYATKDFIADLGSNGLTIQGTLISKDGNINISSGKATVIYDPQYLQPLYDMGKFSYRQMYWTSF